MQHNAKQAVLGLSPTLGPLDTDILKVSRSYPVPRTQDTDFVLLIDRLVQVGCSVLALLPDKTSPGLPS